MGTKLNSVMERLSGNDTEDQEMQYRKSTKDHRAEKVCDFLIGRYEGRVELLLICTDEGRLSSLYPAQEVQRYGRYLSADDLLALMETLNGFDRVKGYLLFAETTVEDDDRFLDAFSNDMNRLLKIYEAENAEKDFLLRTLDFMDNPLCIYDRDAIFRYTFIALNCANFPENLFESELFGYVGGVFTGASKNGQPGKFELADSGTLFLDEIGEMPLKPERSLASATPKKSQWMCVS